MKKNIFAKLITMALITALTATAVCGCGSVAEATETSATEETSPATTKDYAEWSLDEIAAFSDIVSGITDREYAAEEGANHVIYEDVRYDASIIDTVLFDTASVRFDTVGEYGMTYWIYFDMSALAGWMADTDMDETYAGLDTDADILAVSVRAVVAITEAVEEEEEEEESESADDPAASDASDGASVGSGSSTSAKSDGSSSSGASTKSASSASTKSSGSQSCNHNWVEQGYYEDVLVSEGYSYYQCKVCGYISYDASGHEIANHEIDEHDGKASDKLVTVQAKYNSVWHSTGYKCSKCGATK